MCGRLLSLSKQDIVEVVETFGFTLKTLDSTAVHEISPTMSSIVLCKDSMVEMPWGFKISYPKNKILLHARVETLHEKITFKDDYQMHRCVVTMRAFYEWDKERTKWQISLSDDSLLYVAGLYKVIQGISYFVIITQPSPTNYLQIHERIPFLLRQDEVFSYLNGMELTRSQPSLFAKLALEVSNRKAYQSQTLF